MPSTSFHKVNKHKKKKKENTIQYNTLNEGASNNIKSLLLIAYKLYTRRKTKNGLCRYKQVSHQSNII